MHLPASLCPRSIALECSRIDSERTSSTPFSSVFKACASICRPFCQTSSIFSATSTAQDILATSPGLYFDIPEHRIPHLLVARHFEARGRRGAVRRLKKTAPRRRDTSSLGPAPWASPETKRKGPGNALRGSCDTISGRAGSRKRPVFPTFRDVSEPIRVDLLRVTAPASRVRVALVACRAGG